MSEDDPFERLDAPEDREGDPFEQLGDAEPDEEPDEELDLGPVEEPAGEESSVEEPAADGATDAVVDGEDREAGGDDTEPTFEEEFIDAADPFAAGESEPTGESGSSSPGDTGQPAGGDDDPFSGMDDREGDPFGEGESAFEAVDVESLDADEVWESLGDDATDASRAGSRYVEVSKHRFCEQCEHFAEAPAAHCTHEEAEIIEYLDMETVRLLDCPVVAEQRRLADEE